MIPEDAVEAAALGIHIQGGVNVPRARQYALAALEAVLPNMLADVYTSGYVDGICGDPATPNPYRPTP